MRPIILGASNTWFPVVLSPVAIPVESGRLAQLVDDNWAQLNHDPIEPEGSRLLNEINQISEEVNADIKPAANEQPKYQLRPQEFECPRCGQEKIVGVNGSRRWCLNCLAEWPTADVFLAEVNAGGGQDFEQTNRQQLQSRFQNILARLDEPELTKVKTWLDTLEAQLDLTEDTDHANEKGAPINAISVPEYA